MLTTQLLLAVAAGVLLNLTPCVLPAIPIKLRMIMNAVGGRGWHRLLAGIAVLAGSWTFFGAVALATGALGWHWGELFQSRAVRLGLAGVLAALGLLSLAGRGFTPPQWLYHLGGRGYTEPYLAGMLAALLSTPCTGPFLGGVLAFAVSQPPGHILLLFLAWTTIGDTGFRLRRARIGDKHTNTDAFAILFGQQSRQILFRGFGDSDTQHKNNLMDIPD